MNAKRDEHVIARIPARCGTHRVLLTIWRHSLQTEARATKRGFEREGERERQRLICRIRRVLLRGIHFSMTENETMAFSRIARMLRSFDAYVPSRLHARCWKWTVNWIVKGVPFFWYYKKCNSSMISIDTFSSTLSNSPKSKAADGGVNKRKRE